MKRQETHRQAFDLDLEIVDLVILANHRRRLRGVARQQRRNGQIDQLLGARRHVEQSLLDDRELLVKMAMTRLDGGWRHPNLPVTYASVRSSRGLVKISLVRPASMSFPR